MIRYSTAIYYFKDDRRPFAQNTGKIVSTIYPMTIGKVYENEMENRENNDLRRYNILAVAPGVNVYMKSYLIGIRKEKDFFWKVETPQGCIYCSKDTEFLIQNNEIISYGSILDGKIKKGTYIKTFDVNEICINRQKISKVEKYSRAREFGYDAVVFGDMYVANGFVIRSSTITRIMTL